MPALTLLVASIAFADSINPSTIVPALWMAGTPRAHLVSFSLGAFLIYLAGGLVLVFGPGPELISALHHMQGTVEHLIEALAGMFVLVLAFGLWRSRHSQRITRLPEPGATRSSAFVLGAGIMAVELPTAFVYFGAISAILAAHPAPVAEVSLLAVYNALFVAPLLAIVVIRRCAGVRAERWLASAWERLLNFGQLLLAGLTGSAGVALVIIGLSGLLAT
ncbi:MAG: GAP family protein [Solirubrobacteraceae bacterium]